MEKFTNHRNEPLVRPRLVTPYDFFFETNKDDDANYDAVQHKSTSRLETAGNSSKTIKDNHTSSCNGKSGHNNQQYSGSHLIVVNGQFTDVVSHIWKQTKDHIYIMGSDMPRNGNVHRGGCNDDGRGSRLSNMSDLEEMELFLAQQSDIGIPQSFAEKPTEETSTMETGFVGRGGEAGVEERVDGASVEPGTVHRPEDKATHKGTEDEQSDCSDEEETHTYTNEEESGAPGRSTDEDGLEHSLGDHGDTDLSTEGASSQWELAVKDDNSACAIEESVDADPIDGDFKNGENICDFEPPWTKAVGDRGDVFFLQAEESIEYVQSTTPDHKTVQNGHAANGEESTHRKTKKGVKKKDKASKSKKNDVRVMDNNLNHVSSSKVTFNDVPTGVTRDVVLFVDPNRHNFGRRATQCESLFGVIPGNFHTPSQEMNAPCNRDKRIMVQGLFPGGEALRAGVKIGEWLMAVNDLEVNFDNIDTILSSITGPKHVKVTLQKIAIQTSPKHTVVKKNCMNNNLVKLISGERLHEEPMRLQRLPHSVMYLTLDCHSESMKDKEDVLYQFPRAESKLVEVRGIFITLSHMLSDVTHNTAKSSTLLYEDHLVHVSYKKENREVMIIAIPANKLSLVQLNHLCDDVVRILKVLFGSLHSAFTKQEHHSHLDHLFALVFQRALLAGDMLKRGTKQTEFLEPLLDIVMGVRALTMPEETKVTMNNCLSELEAADFADMADEYYGLRRSYVILGSSLFYKGYLLANHLHKEDLSDCALYLHYYCLLTLCNEEQLGQLVVWREIFPTRRCHKLMDPPSLGYDEPEARWFLMVVGMRNALLSIILEAGGCASWAQGNPPPDPFYVDQARATILQLEALDVFNQCEIRLQGPAMPSLACADWFFPYTKASKHDDHNTPVKVQSSPKTTIVTPAKKVTQPESILKKRSTPSPQVDPHRHGRGVVYEVESDQDSLSTGTSEGSTPIMDRRGRKPSAGSDESGESQGSSSLFKGGRRKRNLLSVFDVGDLRRGLGDISLDEQEAGSLVKLTTGCDNTLFHYVHVDELDGILLCPTQQEMLQVATPLHTRILTNFHNACLVIKKGFEHSTKVKALSEGGVEQSKFGVDRGHCGMVEQGLLFRCSPDGWPDSKKAPPCLTYWVVGRLIQDPFPRQFYVCFHDSAEQNLVEMAFKLGFGVSI